MLAAVLKELAGTQVFISTAAVADYRPVRTAQQKIKKTSDTLEVALERTPDVLATVAARPDRPLVVGFAAETESVEQNARTKLMKKNLDLIAANEVGDDKAFDSEENQLIVLTRGARYELGRAGKLVLARGLITLIARELAARAERAQRGTARA
jgi:phosphopantothenoylcysteine decarboxylase/phosphopantothenate--cysteine ligase